MSSKDGSVKVVLTAIIVNSFVTISKSIGWLISLIPSMLAEAIHSSIRGVGSAIHDMEKQIQSRFPDIKYIDLEIN